MEIEVRNLLKDCPNLCGNAALETTIYTPMVGTPIIEVDCAHSDVCSMWLRKMDIMQLQVKRKDE